MIQRKVSLHPCLQPTLVALENFPCFLCIHEHDILTSQTVVNILSLLRHHDLMLQNLDQGVS